MPLISVVFNNILTKVTLNNIVAFAGNPTRVVVTHIILTPTRDSDTQGVRRHNDGKPTPSVEIIGVAKSYLMRNVLVFRRFIFPPFSGLKFKEKT